MASFDEGAFLDLIYGAAVQPDLWVPVMERFAEVIGGTNPFLSRTSILDGTGSAVLTPCIDPARLTEYTDYFIHKNPLNKIDNLRTYLDGWAPRILTDEDWMEKDVLVRSEYYNDFLQPQDVHSVLILRLAMIESHNCVINLTRPARAGQFEGADLENATRLHPHLVRAFDLGHKLASDRRLSGGFASLFDSSPHGLFLLEADGRARRINRAGEALIAAPQGLRVSCGRLSATTAADANRLQALIGAAGSSDPERRAGGSMAIASPSRAVPLSVTVAPVRAESEPLFGGRPCVIVCVTDVEAGVDLPEQKLRQLFALTAAEAKVALALFEGASPREAAAALGVSPNTAKVHLARIFDKTGTNRQSALVRLMMRVVGAGLG